MQGDIAKFIIEGVESTVEATGGRVLWLKVQKAERMTTWKSLWEVYPELTAENTIRCLGAY